MWLDPLNFIMKPKTEAKGERYYSSLGALLRGAMGFQTKQVLWKKGPYKDIQAILQDVGEVAAGMSSLEKRLLTKLGLCSDRLEQTTPERVAGARGIADSGKEELA